MRAFALVSAFSLAFTLATNVESAPAASVAPQVHALTVPAGQSLTYINEGFSAGATTPNGWTSFGDACLTAGSSATPTSSIPACASTAPQDGIGQGTLQLTSSAISQVGMVVWNTPLPTSNGLQITFDDYAFDGTSPGGEGVALFLTDASKPKPTNYGQRGAGMGYSGTTTGAGIANAYLGVGIDEYGGFSNSSGGYTGGPGQIPETIAARGSASTGYQYLGGAQNAAGKPASLPFAFDQPASTTRPTNVPTIRATLTSAGLLSVAVDRHDGNGFVTYYSQSIVGVGGQPAVPANVYFGLSSGSGSHYQVHQVGGVVVTAIDPPTSAISTLVNESFTSTASTPNLWTAFGDSCLTAGTSATPKATSIPACGASVAPVDAAGSGALLLSRSGSSRYGAVIENTALPTANGLQVTYTDYAFNGTTPGGEGVAFFLTDASLPFPTRAGQRGAGLAYSDTTTGAGLPGAYLGVARDEYGGFSNPSGGYTGGPGQVPETIAARGAASSNYQYIGGATNAAGKPASLPFSLDTPTLTTRPATAPTVRATLTAAGVLTVAIDRHDGNGYVIYYTQSIVGVGGQPAVPANVYFGLGSATGSHYQVHEINNLTVTTATGAPITTAADNPPQIVSSNGSLVFNVSVVQNANTGNPQYVYNGSTVPPTLRLLPGDTLTVNLTNNLPTPPSGSSYSNNTNMHFHGLHVSPQAPGDDSIDMLAAPGQSLHYALTLPTNHPPGLYWYHSHAHGEAERQTLSGMSGAIIVDGIAAYTPQVSNMIERVLLVRDAPLPGTALPNARLSQLYAMKWAMQHGVTMHASGATAVLRSSPVGRGGRSELRTASNAASNNPYAPINPKYRRFVRSSTTSSHCVPGNPEAPVHAITLNGQTQPTLNIAPGETQFWRVANTSADTYIDFAVDKTQVQLIAIDGVPLSSGVNTPASLTLSDFVIPPSSRAEFIVTGPPAGTTAYVRTNCFDAGQSGNAMPAEILATINPVAGVASSAQRALVARVSPKAKRFTFHAVAPSAATTARVANVRVPSGAKPSARAAARILSTPVSATQTIYYSDQNDINGVVYDPAAPPQFYAQSGTVQQWNIVNNSYQVHTFHIHQIHFVVQAINGVTQSQQFVWDNVNVPAATASGPGSVTLLLDFTDPLDIGTFLLHCHILSHEDQGMMAKIRVGVAPPLSLSATSASFSSSTAGVQSVAIAGGAAPYGLTGCNGVAEAALSGSSITIAPVAAGACVLTVSDSSSPSITATVSISVAATASSMTLSQKSVGFSAPGSAAAAITINGGTAPYTASGCTNIVNTTVTGALLSVAPVGVGTCTLAVTDANGLSTTLSVAVNATVTPVSPLDNLTFHQNPGRTGWYSNETTLTTSNVNSTTFGQIGTLTAPTGMPALGKVYAQPLFAANELSVDGNTHNLVIVAGAAGQIYAFDENTHAVVWERSFTNAAAGIRQQLWSDTGCADVNPDVGIVGTPVIDRTLDRLFVVVATMENGTPYTRIHAIGLGNGNDVVTPTVISGSVVLATGGIASISSLKNMNRSALLEANSNIYVALGSHCDAYGSSTHGWVLAYSASTLQETGSLVDLSNENDGTNFFLGSPWMGGFGPAADAQGNVYFATGNGPFDGINAFSMSVMKLPGNLNLGAASSFTPIQEAADSLADADLGSGGVMVLPDQPGSAPHIAIAGGKCSTVGGCFKYVLNRDALGGKQTNNAGALWSGSTGGGIWGGPAYFVDSNGTPHVVYGTGGPLNTYNLNLSPFSLSIQSSVYVANNCLECRDAGSQPIVSSNGTTAGSAIVWALKTPGNSGGTISLYAFNAINMSSILFYGPAGTWNPGGGASTISGALVSPLVTDGRVYVPTDGSVSIFGLLSSSTAHPTTTRPLAATHASITQPK
jgi:FtsP/CotA-like multicopper oxidase with cupredoxin domain